MKRIITLLSMAALVVMSALITSCNKMEEGGSGHRVNPDGSITFTMTLHMGADTKTDINGTTGAHTFTVGDQIAVAYLNTGGEQVKAVSNPLTAANIKNSSKSAKFTVTLTEEPKKGEDRNYLYYTYPASITTDDGGVNYSALNTQDGTLASLASDLDCCMAYSLWNGSNDLPTLTLVNRITIGKFTIKNSSGTAINDDLTSVTISDGSNTYTITPTGSTFTEDPIWVAMRPVYEGSTVTVTATDGTDNYSKTVTIAEGKSLEAGKITPINVTMALVWDGDLAKITSESTEEFATATDGMTITGTLGFNKKISIAAGATVTLDNVTINGTNNSSYAWAGLTCLGDATIILKDGTTNTIKGFYNEYPGIFVPSGKTLIIQGSTGSLNASSNGYGAGIGGGFQINCGNIEIQGGVITATGGQNAAGIGGGGNSASCGTITISGGNITANGGGSNAAGIGTGSNGTCGNITISGGSITANGAGIGAGIGTAGGGTCGTITISGGSITAKGGGSGAGIGTGYGGHCGNITISNTVTRVTATKGSSAINSIGKGDETYSTCGTVKFGNETMYNGSSWTTTPTDGGIYDGLSLAITTTTNTNDTWTLTPYVAPSVPAGAIDGLFSVSSTKQVYFSQGNLQYQASTGTWRFAEHQYDFIGDYNVMASETYTGWIDLYPWGTSGIDYTGHATVYRPWETAYSSEYINPYSSLTTNLYDGEGENAGKADWGYNAISNGGNTQNSGWRTLKNNTTDNEWQYIFNSRTTANEINSTSNARYTQARINTDGTLVKGIILFPDGSIGDTPSGVTWGTINATSYGWKNGTQCTTAGWAALEAAGCVFLPASGKYNSGVSGAGDDGYYWSSSYADSEKAYGVFFDSSEVSPQYSDARYYGFSVRLVKDAN